VDYPPTARPCLVLAPYFLPALTTTVFFFAKSRTFTRPRATRVSVEPQRSSTSHFVPTTVAALCLPFVRKRPLPSPHRRRFFLPLAAVLAFAHDSLPTSVSVVSGLLPLVWPILKTPAYKVARASPAATSATRPFVTSTVVPTGIWPLLSSS